MKVAIVTDIHQPHINGVSSFVQRLAALLGRRAHDVLLIAPSTSVRSEYIVRDGVRIFGVPSVPIFLYPRYRWSVFATDGLVKRVIGEFRPNVIHLQTHFALAKAAVRAGRMLNVPILGTNHFVPENVTHYLHLPPSIEARVKKWCWQYFLRTYEVLDVVTTPTVTALELMCDAGFSGTGKVVSNGVDLKLFNPINKTSQLVREFLPKGPKVLFVGRLDKEKNVAFAIKAFAEAAKRIDGHFVITGSGPEERNLRKLARRLGVAQRIVFTGSVPDCEIPALYGAVDVFVMPGKAELQSIATMEAMATGLPVIAAAAIALPELVKNGVNGFLFQPSDQVCLASCMETMLSDMDLCKRMGQASLREIQKHDINATVAKFEALYAVVSNTTAQQATVNAQQGHPV